MRLASRILAIAVLAIVATAPVFALSAVPVFGDVAIGTSRGGAPSGALAVLAGLVAIGMAIRVKDAAAVAQKWVQRASAASGDYAAGVKEAGADWEQNTLAGKENFALGVQQAITDGRYEKGVREAGQAKYVNRASQIGATRFAPGVQNAQNEMARGVQPVLEAIRSLTLPPRRPKGDPGNMERANVVAMALRKLKTGR